MRTRHLAIAAICAAALGAHAALAADTIKVAISHQTSWDTVFPQLALKKGFFKEQNIDASLINATGGADTVQTLTTGSVQFATPTAVHAAITAFAKGAPIRIVGNQLTGAPDIFFYAKTDGPIKKWSDLNGRKLAFSRPGSVTHMLIQNFMREQNLKIELISGGGLPAVRTMLDTGQVDAAWSGAPFALDGVRDGKYKVLFTGKDVKAASTVVNRVTCTSADILKNNRDLVRRFLVAYQKAIDYVYGPHLDEALEMFASANNMSVAEAKEALNYFGDKKSHDMAPIENFDEAINQTVEFGLIKEKLTAAQVKELVDIVYDPHKKGS